MYEISHGKISPQANILRVLLVLLVQTTKLKWQRIQEQQSGPAQPLDRKLVVYRVTRVDHDDQPTVIFQDTSHLLLRRHDIRDVVKDAMGEDNIELTVAKRNRYG